MGVEWFSALLALLCKTFFVRYAVIEKKGRGKIASLVEACIRIPIEEAGYLLWDVDFYKEGTDFNLLVTIENPDREKPIDLDDCEKVTHLINPILDEADPIEGSYYLEVSSAGLERTLERPEHFDFYRMSPVNLRLYAPIDGTKSITGILLSAGEEGICLKMPDGTEATFKKESVAKVMTVNEKL